MISGTEMTPAQERRRQEQAVQTQREHVYHADRAQHRKDQKLSQVEADKQASLKNKYDSYQLELKRAKIDFDEFTAKAQEANTRVQKYERLLKEVLSDGYIVPTPPAPEPVVAHKTAPPAPPIQAPVDIGAVQAEVNQKAQQEAAEEEARRYTACPVCSERILKTQLPLVHKKKSNKYMCIPSRDPRALIRAGVASSLEHAQAMYSEEGISPDTLKDIASLLEDSAAKTQEGTN